jgi:hypothetical protein
VRRAGSEITQDAADTSRQSKEAGRETRQAASKTGREGKPGITFVHENPFSTSMDQLLLVCHVFTHPPILSKVKPPSIRADACSPCPCRPSVVPYSLEKINYVFTNVHIRVETGIDANGDCSAVGFELQSLRLSNLKADKVGRRAQGLRAGKAAVGLPARCLVTWDVVVVVILIVAITSTIILIPPPSMPAGAQPEPQPERVLQLRVRPGPLEQHPRLRAPAGRG